MNKKKRIIYIVITLLCIIISISIVLRFNRPIVITSDMSNDKFLSRVELSNGELWFKTHHELLTQLTPEDVSPANGNEYFHPLDDIAVPYYELNTGKQYSREEILKMMNIYPEYWRVGDILMNDTLEFHAGGNASFNEPISFINGNRSHPIYGESCFLFDYKYEYGSIWISAAPTPVKWLGNITVDNSLPARGMVSVRATFGNMDSRIGNVEMSVKSITDPHSTYFSAFFIVEQTAYIVTASNKDVSQEDFINLLISICSAPHPEKRNLIDLLLDS